MSKKRLGKGLEALIPSGQTGEEASHIPLEQIESNPFQPRDDYSEESLAELAESVEQHGIIQPLIVRKKDKKKFQIVAGERRWRAAEKVGLKTVPVIIRDFADRQMMEVALIENLQREDLNPMEEARALENLIGEFDMTQEEVARTLGKSRASIANSLRLLKLDPEVQENVSRETISMGHARALLSLPSAESQREVARIVVREGYNVRQTEKLVARWQEKTPRRVMKAPSFKNEQIKKLEEDIKESLGLKVAIRPRGPEKGTVNLEYRSLQELEKIYALLGKEKQM